MIPNTALRDFAAKVAKDLKIIAITIFDAGMIPNTALRDFAAKVAKDLKIPTQISISEGGATDGGRIHLCGDGVLTLTFSIPTRYIHSHQSRTYYRND